MKTETPVLRKSEVIFCGFIWVSAVIYCCFKVYEIGQHFDFSQNGDDFEKGWFFGWRKDCADSDWRICVKILKKLIPWFAIHLIVSEFTRWLLIEALPVCYFLITNLYILNNAGPKVFLLFFGKVVLHFLVLRARSEMLVWFICTGYLIFIAFGYSHAMAASGISEFEVVHFTLISSAWMLLRCTSFCLDYIRSSTPASKPGLKTFLLLLGYTNYLPLFFFGPYMLYENFEKGNYGAVKVCGGDAVPEYKEQQPLLTYIRKPKVTSFEPKGEITGFKVKEPFTAWNFRRFSNTVFNLLRFGAWIVFLDILLHFLYIHALEYHLPLVSRYGPWYLNGLVYLLAVFFCTKYIAFYGLAGTLAKAERYDPPPPPLCACYAYCDRHLWRTFDVGYYQFMKRYIYIPLLGDGYKSLGRRLFASGMTFGFVFMWHGITVHIFLWSLFNYLELALESAMLQFAKSKRFRNWVEGMFSKQAIWRLSAVVFAPFSVHCIFFNSFFYTFRMGGIINRQFLEGDWVFYVTIFILAYCFCITAFSLVDLKQAAGGCDKARNRQPQPITKRSAQTEKET